LLEDGAAVTETAIAKVLRISRMSLWRIHRRNPGLRRWVGEQLRSSNEHLIGPVVHMLGTTAIRTKSPKHAELFLKATGAIDVKTDSGADVSVVGPGQVTMNFLVPQPAMPAPPGVTINLPPAALPAPVIPTIEVR
jgi:hypothetical protein